ncbi:MAG: AAA family ATPase, partial [Raoultibacter sp.]
MTYGSLKPDGYIPRIVDNEIARYLSVFGAVEIAGTKWCGKTWAARAHAESISYVDRGNNLDIAKADPSLMLLGEKPHVIDEWQSVPALWDVVRHSIDDSAGEKGRWILTGSSTPHKDEVSHSGAGRIGRIRMSPMSLAESGDSAKSISLSGLFEGVFEPQKVEVDTTQLLAYACRGGWPEAINIDVEDAQLIAREYLRSVFEQSVPRAGKDSDTAQRLVASLARNLCQAVTYKTLQKDMVAGEEDANEITSAKTIAEYIAMLESLYLID